MITADTIADDPTAVECPVVKCGAWVGWACKGPKYGAHCAGYHPSRVKAARARSAEILNARKVLP